jgi:hypothetical protein
MSFQKFQPPPISKIVDIVNRQTSSTVISAGLGKQAGSPLERLALSVNPWVTGGHRFTEETMEFAAGRVEKALRLFRAVMNQQSGVGVDDIAQKTIGSNPSQRLVFVHIAEDLSAKHPKVVHVFMGSAETCPEPKSHYS